MSKAHSTEDIHREKRKHKRNHFKCELFRYGDVLHYNHANEKIISEKGCMLKNTTVTVCAIIVDYQLFYSVETISIISLTALLPMIIVLAGTTRLSCS